LTGQNKVNIVIVFPTKNTRFLLNKTQPDKNGKFLKGKQ